MTGDAVISDDAPATLILPPLPAPDGKLGRKLVTYLHEFGPLELVTLIRVLDDLGGRVESTIHFLKDGGYVTRTTLPGTFTPAWMTTGRWDPNTGPRASAGMEGERA